MHILAWIIIASISFPVSIYMMLQGTVVAYSYIISIITIWICVEVRKEQHDPRYASYWRKKINKEVKQ